MAAEELGVSETDFGRLVLLANKRIESAVSVRDAITMTPAATRVGGVAGVLRLSSQAQLEIVPKFLAGDDASWREDFLFIAMLTQYGQILAREDIASQESERVDLSDLIGRAMIDLFDRSARRPLRTYRQRRWTAWELDGDVDAEDLILPDAGGYRQRGLHLDRDNDYSRVIRAGMEALLPATRSPDVRQGLSERLRRLGATRTASRRRQVSLPPRHTHWQELYDLSRAVLRNRRLEYGDAGGSLLPGFLLATAPAWEALVRLGLGLGAPQFGVRKVAYDLGRARHVDGRESELRATPDVTLTRSGQVALVVDAKYKVPSANEVARADLYEMLAYLQCTKCDTGVLLYPWPQERTPHPPMGVTQVLSRLTVDSHSVIAAAVSARGISAPEGLWNFGQRLATSVLGVAGLTPTT